MLAALKPRRHQIWYKKSIVEDFPFVPVTPQITFGEFGKSNFEISDNFFLGLETLIIGIL